MKDEIFKAMADPTRRNILKLLRKGDMTAGDITNNFNMRGASISHHLSILRNAGLVLSEKKGQFVVYSINMTVFQEVMEWFFDFKGGKK